MDVVSKRVEIIPAKRRVMILDHLRANGAASIQELTEAIGGSQSTIRRDLERLDRIRISRTDARRRASHSADASGIRDIADALLRRSFEEQSKNDQVGS